MDRLARTDHEHDHGRVVTVTLTFTDQEIRTLLATAAEARARTTGCLEWRDMPVAQKCFRYVVALAEKVMR